MFNDDVDFINLGNKKYSGNKDPVKNVSVKNIEVLNDSNDLYDLTLEDNSSHIFPVNGYMLTHNCGGGNPLSHPDLIWFLEKIKTQGLVANITINQKHLSTYKELILKLIKEQLVMGVGISYSSSKYLVDIEPILLATNNVVFHVIMGINPVSDVEKLNAFCLKHNKECKILVLGYKHYGFGINYYVKNKKIEDVKYNWYTTLASYFKNNNLILSFDNLAIEQLKLRRYFTDSAWEQFFMGNDFVFTMYIDGVEQNFAPSSTSTNRQSFKDVSLVDYFQNNRNKK